MKTLCLYFQVHQPLRLRKYRFFNLGKDHNYLDENTNRALMSRIAQNCYLPMNALLLELIRIHAGSFKVSFSITGCAIEQFKSYAPEVLESFKALAKTGCVEFLGETYDHSLASLTCPEEFKAQVVRHSELIEQEFGLHPTVFRNTELIYSDDIGADVAELGFSAILAEGAKHILGWKSPNYLYTNAINQKLKVLLRNFKLSDDIAFRFSDQGWESWPLKADTYTTWLEEGEGECINLFMDYETFGEHQSAQTGIFDFMEALPAVVLAQGGISFCTPSEVCAKWQPASVLHAPYPTSWADEERDITAWLGNELQNEAFTKLYQLRDDLLEANDEGLNHVWDFMQESDHFYYMATKWFSDGDVHSYFNPYESPYDAFINYMNVLSDLQIEVKKRLDKDKTQ